MAVAGLVEGLKDHVLGHKTNADWYIAAAIAVSFPVARFLLDKFVFDGIGRRILHIPGYKKSDDPEQAAKLATLEKWKESAYKCCVQILFTVVLLTVSTQHQWFYNSKLFWDECTKLPCDAPVSLGERLAYCLTLGFYIQAVPMLFLWETKRKDRLEVFAHHIATIVLIAYSYYLNLTRVGVMVLVCHEANDIFMEAAKMLRYAGSNKMDSMLVVFVVSWFTTRVFIYPAYIIRSTLFESKERAAFLGISMQPHYTILNFFLIFLYILHIYWSYLIVRIAVRQYTHGDAGDIREEGEEIPSEPSGAGAKGRRKQVPAVPSDVSISRLPANAS